MGLDDINEQIFIDYAPQSALELQAMIDAYRDMEQEGMFDE